jgi:flavin reductase (DIM6/NTAB) family NADH-FMN oxidoreductase RutF
MHNIQIRNSRLSHPNASNEEFGSVPQPVLIIGTNDKDGKQLK